MVASVTVTCQLCVVCVEIVASLASHVCCVGAVNLICGPNVDMFGVIPDRTEHLALPSKLLTFDDGFITAA